MTECQNKISADSIRDKRHPPGVSYLSSDVFVTLFTPDGSGIRILTTFLNWLDSFSIFKHRHSNSFGRTLSKLVVFCFCFFKPDPYLSRDVPLQPLWAW